MAIPSFFATSYGRALMRQNVSTGEWFFVQWYTGSADFAYDAPGPGSWTYAIWLVIGRSGAVSPILSLTYAGPGQLIVQQLRR